MKLKIFLSTTALLVFLFIFSFFKLSIISIPPNGYALDGMTVVAWKQDGLFDSVDSVKSLCKRRIGKVTNMCVSKGLMTVIQMDVIVKLPYFKPLDMIS